MDALKALCPIILIAVLTVAAGCEKQSASITGSDRKLAWSAPTWSTPVEGVQCRLRTAKRTWRTDEVPVLRVDIRNTGARIFAFFPEHQQQFCRIEFDGQWYYWPHVVRIDSEVWPFAPGIQLNNIGVKLHNLFGIEVAPGKHIVRVALDFENVQVVSNPVGIEVRKYR